MLFTKGSDLDADILHVRSINNSKRMSILLINIDCRVSLNFHPAPYKVGGMLSRALHFRGLSRLMAGLFAVQVVVTGFCLLTASAHAMSMAQTHHQVAGEMAEHCSKAMDGEAGQQSDGCFHCDDPNLFVKSVSADLPAFAPVWSLVVLLPGLPQWHAPVVPAGGLLATGPPRSSSLLYITTQRIRI